MRLRQTRLGSAAIRERDMEETVQELEARVAMLESQKEVLQNKLGLAKQHIVDLRARTPYKYSKSENDFTNQSFYLNLKLKIYINFFCVFR